MSKSARPNDAAKNGNVPFEEALKKLEAIVEAMEAEDLPLETLLVETSYTRNRITLPGQPVYTTNVLSTRVSYSFSPTIFAKAFAQYNDARRLASLNLLFWSIYRPGSDLYVVYNQGWDTNVPDNPHFLQVHDRSLAVKLTYWLSR